MGFAVVMARKRHFASDNNSGVCPEAWAALEKADQAGHATGYGDDPWTQEASERLRELFERDCEIFFVFNGTAANALSLAHLVQPYESVLVHRHAHAEEDECGAPEFFTGGAKVRKVDGSGAKIDPAALEKALNFGRDVHFPRPGAVSLTQSTEFGRCYSLSELSEITELSRGHSIPIHMDGARFSNAVASLGCTPAEMVRGIDVLSFGGTKNGTAVGDVVVFFDSERAGGFDARIKQAGQLASKMRYLSAPWVGLLESGAWLQNATHANEMAQLLHARLSEIDGVNLLEPCEANGVFVDLPEKTIASLHDKEWHFYRFIGETGCRLMTSWDTTEEDVEEFTSDLAASI